MNLHEIMLAKQLAGANGGGNVDLSDYYTKSQTDGLISEKVAEIVADAPEDFDTLKEMSDWIVGHEDSAAAMNSAIAANTAAITQKADKTTTYTKTETDNLLNNKVDKVTGKGLSTNDFTDADKSKLDSLENYDDTDVKADVEKLANQAAINKSTLGYQRKNLLKNIAVSQTKNGVSFTVNDSVVKVITTTPATETTTLKINENIKLPKGNYVLSAGVNSPVSDIRLFLNNQVVHQNQVFSIENDTDIINNVYIYVYKGSTISTELTYYPMIRPVEITDDTYEPYRPSIEERLTALENAILGGN